MDPHIEDMANVQCDEFEDEERMEREATFLSSRDETSAPVSQRMTVGDAKALLGYAPDLGSDV